MLCYTTYQYFKFKFNCNCGSKGSLEIGQKPLSFKKGGRLLDEKGRLCCPNDRSPLFSIVEKHIKSNDFEVVCKKCQTLFDKA